MKLLSYIRALGAALGLVLLGAIAQANFSPLWQSNTPSVTGPWLGDNSININTLWQATTQSSGVNYWPSLSVSQTSGQANCTQLQPGMSEVKTSASTGYVCLPTAIPGRNVYIGNASGQTIDLYGSASTYVQGTQDTINGTTGTTPYTNLTNGKNVDCFSPNGGAWYCSSGS